MPKKAKLSTKQRYANGRACQENYRHRVRRFTLQFSLKDTAALEWFEKQPNKGKYLKDLILADMERQLKLYQTEVDGMAEKTVIDKALDIIGHTNDGDDLSPPHLKLVEMAVNGMLNDKGIKMFDDIHKQVMDGEYRRPYLQGVEFMTQDHEGYIYFKDHDVEHFSRPWAYSLEAKDYLERLKSRCLFLEGKGIKISFGNAMNMPDELEKEYIDDVLYTLNSSVAEHSILFSRVSCDNDNTRSCEYMVRGFPASENIWNNKYAADFIENNSDRDICDGVFNAKVTLYSYGNGKARTATDDEMKQLNLCFDYLQKNNMLQKLSESSNQLNLNEELEDENEDEAEI